VKPFSYVGVGRLIGSTARACGVDIIIIIIIIIIINFFLLAR